MLKRLTALFFILAVAGQAWAGVCGCFKDDGANRHACCKKQRSDVTSMSRTGCCDTDCAISTSENGPRSTAENPVRISLKAQVTAAILPIFAPQPLPTDVSRVAPSRASRWHQYSRPPNLYLFHHSFLI